MGMQHGLTKNVLIWLVKYSFDDGVPDGGDIINDCVLIDNAMSITHELDQENTLSNVKKVDK